MEPAEAAAHPPQSAALPLTRNQKAKRRRRLLRQYKLAGPQDSQCSDAPSALGSYQPQQQQQQQHAGCKRSARSLAAAPPPQQPKKLRTASPDIWQVIAASVDSAACCAPASGTPVQAAAQVSDGSVQVGATAQAAAARAHAGAQQQQRPAQQQCGGSEECVPPQKQREQQQAGEATSGASVRQDWSGAATMLAGALLRQETQVVVTEGSSKTAAVCRMDLSHAALVIGAHIAGQAPLASVAAVAGRPAGDLGIEDAVHGATAGTSAPRDCLPAAPCVSGEQQAGAGGEEMAAVEEQKWEQDEGAAGTTAKKPKRPRRVFVHGNYHRYYGYRLGDAFTSDPRLAVLERGWFAGRRCLDVGCNEGAVTLALATRFGTRSMVGVDIDEVLIRRACTSLRQERERVRGRAAAARHGGTPAAERRGAAAALAALARTWFVHGDFSAAEGDPSSVDTITCLSVTKWVHLHRGDEGLRAFFARCAALLAPGGLLVLEPQPWSSYQTAALKIRKAWAALAAVPAPPGAPGTEPAAAPASGTAERVAAGEATDGRAVEPAKVAAEAGEAAACTGAAEPAAPAAGAPAAAAHPLAGAFFHRLAELCLRPEGFANLLCDEMGFRLVRRLQVGSSSQGFDRPLLVFRKRHQ